MTSILTYQLTMLHVDVSEPPGPSPAKLAHPSGVASMGLNFRTCTQFWVNPSKKKNYSIFGDVPSKSIHPSSQGLPGTHFHLRGLQGLVRLGRRIVGHLCLGLLLRVRSPSHHQFLNYKSFGFFIMRSCAAPNPKHETSSSFENGPITPISHRSNNLASSISANHLDSAT